MCETRGDCRISNMDFMVSDIQQDEMEEECDLPLAHQASASGDMDALTRAIQMDPTVLEQQDTEGMTPLGHAVVAEQLEAAKLLVKVGAFINTSDKLGRTCLSLAAYQGWYEGVQLLLRNGASQTLCDKAGRSALHSATYSTNIDVWKLLLQNVSIDDLNQQDFEGMTPLHWTAFHDRPAHASILLERGADARLHDVDGKTVLHWAAQNGSHECCAVLLGGAGAMDILNRADFSDKMAVHFAAAAGHARVIDTFARTGRCVLEAGDPDDRTPLHWAAAMGKSEAVATLLSQNVDPVPEDVEGNTPLDYARQSGHQGCVDILEERLGVRKQKSTNDQTLLSDRPPQQQKKKNRLSFFSELFRSKKGGGASSDGENKDRNGVDRRRESVSDVSINFESQNHRTESNGGSLESTQSGYVKLRTLPNIQTDTDSESSLKKLQVSRQDNPILQEKQSSVPKGNRTLSIDTGSHQDCPVGGHPSLIRSPPPMFSRDMGLRSERNRAQLEEDAAQILALHPSNTPRAGMTPRALTPRALSPIKSRANSLETSFPFDSTDVSNPTAENIRHGPPQQLAPIKGALPKMGQPLNKRLDVLRGERTGANRSPTPPGWNNDTTNSSVIDSDTTDSCSSEPDLTHYMGREKKKAGNRHLHAKDAVNHKQKLMHRS